MQKLDRDETDETCKIDLLLYFFDFLASKLSSSRLWSHASALEAAMNTAFDQWPKRGANSTRATALATQLRDDTVAACLRAAPDVWVWHSSTPI